MLIIPWRMGLMGEVPMLTGEVTFSRQELLQEQSSDQKFNNFVNLTLMSAK